MKRRTDRMVPRIEVRGLGRKYRDRATSVAVTEALKTAPACCVLVLRFAKTRMIGSQHMRDNSLFVPVRDGLVPWRLETAEFIPAFVAGCATAGLAARVARGSRELPTWRVRWARSAQEALVVDDVLDTLTQPVSMLRGTLTGRWASSGHNLQNYIRPK